MSSRRFELILRFLHLNDSQTQPQRNQPGFNKQYKLRPLLDLLLPSFKDNYTPSQYVSIDESMIAFKGRLSLQYLPKKPHKWEPKSWVLADAVNGYTWNWKLYTGKKERQVVTGLAHRVVLELLDDVRLQQKGYVVITDNFYSLFRDLLQRGFGACGTARKDRRGIPPAIREKRGEVTSSCDLALKWRDVLMLSTYHDSAMVTKSRRSRRAVGVVEDIEKPQVVEDYNQNMGGVDKSKSSDMNIHDDFSGDQLVLYYVFSHRSVKWWKRVFFHLLDLSLVNSHILYKAATSSRITQLDFRVAVAKSLQEGLERPRHRHHEPAPELHIRLTERAFPEHIPGGKRADCKVCSVRDIGERHQTAYRYKLCYTPLCLYPVPHPQRLY